MYIMANYISRKLLRFHSYTNSAQTAQTSTAAVQRGKLQFTFFTRYFSELALTLNNDAQILLYDVLSNFEAFSPLQSERL